MCAAFKGDGLIAIKFLQIPIIQSLDEPDPTQEVTQEPAVDSTPRQMPLFSLIDLETFTETESGNWEAASSGLPH